MPTKASSHDTKALTKIESEFIAQALSKVCSPGYRYGLTIAFDAFADIIALLEGSQAQPPKSGPTAARTNVRRR